MTFAAGDAGSAGAQGSAPSRAEVEAELRTMLNGALEQEPPKPAITSEGAPEAVETAAPSTNAVVSLADERESVRRDSNPKFPRRLPEVGVELFSAIENYQTNLIRQALARTDGNRNRAAQLLGINRTTLVEMIRRHKL